MKRTHVMYAMDDRRYTGSFMVNANVDVGRMMQAEANRERCGLKYMADDGRWVHVLPNAQPTANAQQPQQPQQQHAETPLLMPTMNEGTEAKPIILAAMPTLPPQTHGETPLLMPTMNWGEEVQHTTPVDGLGVWHAAQPQPRYDGAGLGMQVHASNGPEEALVMPSLWE